MKHEIRGHTAFVTIDNPPANTWTPDSLTALEQLVAKLNDDRSVYAAVITGTGEKFFSAGADLMLKDLTLVTDAAKSVKQPVMLGALAQQIYQKHSNDGHGLHDFSSVILQYLKP